MAIKIYRHRESGQIVQMAIPDRGVSDGKISYGNAFSTKDRGQCDFEYHAARESLVITNIRVRPEGSGLGALLLFEVVNYAMRWFPGLTRVVADMVVPDARGFYLQIGFRPTSANMEMNNSSVPPTGDAAGFASAYFQARGPGAVIYQATNGRSVTRNMFSMRIEAARGAEYWEASPLTVRMRTQTKSLAWEEVAS